MVTIDEKIAFSERLNTALDNMKFPAKGGGRQTRLAKVISEKYEKISQKGVRKWLEAESIPSMENLIRLAKITNVSLEWLVTGRGGLSIASNILDIDTPLAYGYTKETVDLITRIEALPAPLRETVTTALEQAEKLLNICPAVGNSATQKRYLEQQRTEEDRD